MHYGVGSPERTQGKWEVALWVRGDEGNHPRQKVCGSCIRALGMRVSVMTERGYLWQQDHQSCDWVSQMRPVLDEPWTPKKAEAIRRIGPLLTCHNALLEERTIYYRRISSLWVPSRSPGMRSWGRLCALYRITEKGERTNLNHFHFKSIWLSHIGKKWGIQNLFGASGTIAIYRYLTVINLCL